MMLIAFNTSHTLYTKGYSGSQKTYSKKHKNKSPLHLPLKPDAVFKKERASKVPIHLREKVNRLLDNLEQYEIISPVNKEEQPKVNTFISPVIIFAKGESLKIVLATRYLNSLIDESKCNWPIEPIQVTLTKINGKYFTTADMNSAYNQMPPTR